MDASKKDAQETWTKLSDRTMLLRLQNLYDAGEVTRLHTVPTVRAHRLSEHIYGALLIGTELARKYRPTPPLGMLTVRFDAVVTALLYHDAPEVDTGDMPAPTKRADANVAEVLDRMERLWYRSQDVQMPELNEVESMICKAADTLDLGFCAVYEKQMGNHHHRLATLFNNVIDYTADKCIIDGVPTIRSYLSRAWNNL